MRGVRLEVKRHGGGDAVSLHCPTAPTVEKQLRKDGRTEEIREDKSSEMSSLQKYKFLKETSVFKLLLFSFVKMKPISIARLLFPTK